LGRRFSQNDGLGVKQDAQDFCPPSRPIPACFKPPQPIKKSMREPL
jgi:hypothetical protein